MEIDNNDDDANDEEINGMDELGIRVKLRTRKYSVSSCHQHSISSKFYYKEKNVEVLQK